MFRYSLGFLAAFWLVQPASAQFNMLLPQKATKPDSSEVRRKALEAEREKLMMRLAEIDGELAKLKPAAKPGDPVVIDNFLGISADFTVYARWEEDKLSFVELQTGKKLPAPAWDRDWGRPRAVLFGKGFIAVPAGRALSSTASDSIKIFSSKSLELEQNLRGRYDAANLTLGERVLALAIGENVSGANLILLDAATGKTTAELKLKQRFSLAMAVADKYVAIGQGSGFGDSVGLVTIVDVAAKKEIAQVKLGNFKKSFKALGEHLPLAISSSGKLLAWGNDDAVIVYDVAAEKVVHTLKGHLDEIRAVAFSTNEEFVVSSGRDKTIRFWKLSSGETVQTIKNVPAVASAMIFAPDGKRMLTVLGEKERRKYGDVRAEIRAVELK